MAKEARLPDDQKEFEDFLAELPNEVAEQNPNFYALKLIAQNGREGTNKSFQDIAGKVNNDLDLLGEGYVSAMKLGKLVKNPLPTIENIVAASQDYQRSLSAENTPPRSPQPVERPQTDLLDYRNPALTKALLQVMEFTARVTGDKNTETTLAAMNKDLAGGKDYKNPLIATLEAPQKVTEAVEKAWVEGKAREDRAFRVAENAIDTVRDTAATAASTVQAAWNRAVEDTATVKKGLGSFLAGAADIGRAVADRAKQDLELVQSALYARETIGSETKGEETSEAQRLRLAEMLKDTVTR
jgi:hypothetical protein